MNCLVLFFNIHSFVTVIKPIFLFFCLLTKCKSKPNGRPNTTIASQFYSVNFLKKT